MAKKYEYVVYLAPNGSVLLDWNNGLWRVGKPAFLKKDCLEVERGTTESARDIIEIHKTMVQKYEKDTADLCFSY